MCIVVSLYSTPTLDYSNFKINSVLFIERYFTGWNLMRLQMLALFTYGVNFEMDTVDSIAEFCSVETRTGSIFEGLIRKKYHLI